MHTAVLHLLWLHLPKSDDTHVNPINRLAWKDLELPLPDSITEWGLLAVSASPHTGTHGACCGNTSQVANCCSHWSHGRVS